MALILFAAPLSLSLTHGIALEQVFAEEDSKAGGYGPAVAAETLGLSSWNSTIFSILSSLGFFVAYIGGHMLDVSAGIFTIHMAGIMDAENLNINASVVASWEIIRDLFNLFFIFGLIAVGFQLILNVNESNSRKTLGSIIIAALLINFSLYATQLLIDFSNVMSYQISNLVSTNTSDTLFGFEYPKISNGFINLSGVAVTTETEGLTKITEEPIFTGGVDNAGSALILGLLFLIFYMILGFVFAAGAIILFTRFLALIVLMIFSPIFFIGMVLPYFKSLGDMWQRHFVSNLLVGPAYLFMIYVSLRSLQGIGGATGEFSLIGFIFQLLIVAGFLIMSLMVAKQVGSFGANKTVGMTRKLGTWTARRTGQLAAGATVGGAAALLRSQIGRRAQDAAESDSLRDAAAKSGREGWVARRKLNLARKIGDTSFDARKIGGVGNKLGIGDGGKGYASRTKAVVEREQKFAESLGTVSDKDEAVANLQIDVDTTDQAIKNKQAQIKQIQAQKKDAKTDKERNALQAEIDLIKSDIESDKDTLKKNKQNLERERNRRQLGSEVKLDTDLAKKRDDLDTDLKRELTKLSEAGEDEVKKKEARDNIAKTKKAIAEHKEKMDAAAGGYATTVADFGAIKNFFMGRNSAQSKEAGKEIRKKYEKKVKDGDKAKKGGEGTKKEENK